MSITTYWISLPWATFGLDVQQHKVTLAAPIAGWSVGRPINEVVRYYHSRGAEISSACVLAIQPKQEAGQ